MRIALVALALVLAGCDREGAAPQGGAEAPRLDAPAPETEHARVFAPTNDAATSATGQITSAMTLHLADAGAAGESQEVLTLTGANGVTVEAELTGAVSPATQVQGQTLRALLSIPVEEPQVLVYRVRNQTRAGEQGICGGEAASHVVVWEPAGPGEPVMKVLGLIGGAPGAGGARACPMLEYRRT